MDVSPVGHTVIEEVSTEADICIITKDTVMVMAEDEDSMAAAIRVMVESVSTAGTSVSVMELSVGRHQKKQSNTMPS